LEFRAGPGRSADACADEMGCGPGCKLSKQNALQSRKIGKGDGMIRLMAIIEKNSLVAICLACAIGLLVSLAVSTISEYSPEAWF
jgi:hypothetical protein